MANGDYYTPRYYSKRRRERPRWPPWCRNPLCCCTCGFAYAILFGVATALLGAMYYPSLDLLQEKLNWQVSLGQHSDATSDWTQSHSEVATYYFFNVTNPGEVQYNGSTPKLQLVGPYNYTKRVAREKFWWDQNDTQILYNSNVSYVQTQNQSRSDPNAHNITTINVPLVALLNLFENPVLNSSSEYTEIITILKAVFRGGDIVRQILMREELFIHKTPEEIVFGYEDPVMKILNQRIPQLFTSATFSLMQKNTEIGPNVMYTGLSEPTLKGEFVQWNGMTSIDSWGTATAQMINGSDGTLFGTGLTRNDTIYIFSDQAKRSFYFNFENDTCHFGIKTYRYSMPSEELDRKSMDRGFFPDGPSGVFNLSAVESFDAPVFASLPFFFGANSGYKDNITFIGDPDVGYNTSFYLDIEPTTGTPMEASKPIQFNVRVVRYSEYIQLRDLKPVTMLPVFYSTESLTLTEDEADQFKKKVLVVNTEVSTGFIVGACVSGVLFLVSLVLVVLCILRGCRKLREYHRATSQYQDMNNVLSPVERRTVTKASINDGKNHVGDDEPLLLAQESSSSDEDFGTDEPTNGLLTREV